jgi:hypothetical protein
MAAPCGATASSEATTCREARSGCRTSAVRERAASRRPLQAPERLRGPRGPSRCRERRFTLSRARIRPRSNGWPDNTAGAGRASDGRVTEGIPRVTEGIPRVTEGIRSGHGGHPSGTLQRRASRGPGRGHEPGCYLGVLSMENSRLCTIGNPMGLAKVHRAISAGDDWGIPPCLPQAPTADHRGAIVTPGTCPMCGHRCAGAASRLAHRTALDVRYPEVMISMRWPLGSRK